MAYCILPNDREYLTLASRSGIPTINENFKNFVGYYREHYGRDPYLDEIPNADSKEFIAQSLGVEGTTTKYADRRKVELFTLETDLDKAQQKLNTIFRDKEIELKPIGEEIIININDRPSKFKAGTEEVGEIINPDSTTFFVDGLYKMAKLYGINFKLTSDKQIEEQFLDLHVLDSKAFVYNGDIYINIDKADVTSPIHEMLHILVGTMRFTNPEFYNSILEYISNLPNYEHYSKLYPNRTMNDLSEEVFVDLVAKLLTSKESKLPKELYKDIFYEIQRNLDTLLMGNYSTTSIPLDTMLDMNLLEIGKTVQSSRMVNNFSGLLRPAHIHRLMNNVKSDLIRLNLLKEICI